MSRPHRRLWLSTLAASVATGALGASAPVFAQPAWEAPADDPRARRMQLGLRLGGGWAGAAKTDDVDGQPTLLFGSAFTGSTFQASGGFEYTLTDPTARAFTAGLRAELGIGTYATSGFAETEAYRREIRFSTVHLEIPLLLDLTWRFGSFAMGVHAGAGARLGVSAAAEEIRSAGSPPDPPLSIRTGFAPAVIAGAHVAVDLGTWVLPLEVRWRMNPTYPSTTRDRFDAWVSPESTGAYLVDTGWSVALMTGFDVRVGGARTSEPEVAYVPPPEYTAPPQPPPPPALPDQDADGVPDIYDACPIEPVLPGEVGPYPGCPASGGIVTVSCDYIDIAMPIDFDSGSARVADESWPILYILADTLAVTRNIRLVRVEGHTDDRGSSSANTRLSQERAEAVVEFLIDAGVEPHRLEAVGYGPDYPVADNDTEEGRRLNRRVEFLILENDTCE